MPWYVYVCPKGHRHETTKRINDRVHDKCPVCGEMAGLVICAPNLNKYPVKSVRVNGEEVR